jgi:hypothetical protein
MKKIIITVIICVLLFFAFFLFPVSSSTKDTIKNLLQKPFNLLPGSEVGDKDFYSMETVYLDMDEAGKVSQTTVLKGNFSREVERNEREKRREKFVWEAVKVGSAKKRKEIKEYKTLSYAENFSYSFDKWTHERFPVDLTSIPKTLEGWSFVVNLMDAHTFDAIISMSSGEKRLVHVGDSLCFPQHGIPIVMDFPPLFTDTYFENAVVRVDFRGITLRAGEPCAIIAFKSDDSQVHMITNMNGMKFPSDGISYYYGDIFFSLGERKIVRGKIIERVDLITSLGSGTPLKRVIRREITLEKLDKASPEL